MSHKIPCFLIARDRFNCLKSMVEYLNTIPEIEVIILDNASTYQPLLDWYDTKPCIVERLTANYGNCSVLFSGPECIPNHIKPDFFTKYDCTNGYILSDCDLDLSGIPHNFMETLREGMAKYDWCTKIGFQLRIDDLPDNELAQNALGWEQLNHSPQTYLDDRRFQKAPIDTTFALYRWMPAPNTALAHDFNGSIRCAELVCRHLTWYYTAENIPEDERYYAAHCDRAFNHYSSRLNNIVNGRGMTEGLV